MERRKFIIGAVAGSIGLGEYIYVSRYMDSMLDPHALSVKAYERWGEEAALLAITANEDFYITSKGGTPAIEASKWQLKVEGLVSRPFTLTYSDLVAMPSIEKEMTLECISNPIGGNAIGNAKWKGAPLKPLLERAQPAPNAGHVVISAADGYSTGLPVSRLWNDENFLAYRMNGEPLPPNHGYPVRVFIPGKFGMKQPKWINRIRFVDHPYTGYWENQGWADDCERWAQARFTDLKSGAKIQGPRVELTGYAVGNLDGIREVQISLDDGHSWIPTSLFSNPSPMVWSFWKFRWSDPRPGRYRLRVRAMDGKGRLEGDGPRHIFPDGATGQHVLAVTVI